MSVLAIVSKAVFKKAQKGKPALEVGDVFETSEYVSKNKRLQRLADGGSLYLVTVRPDDVLWLLAILENPTFAKDRWTASANKVAITDITALKSKLTFDTGKGIQAKPGALGMSLQTPRGLTEDDEALLRKAAGSKAKKKPAKKKTAKKKTAKKKTAKKKTAKKKTAKKKTAKKKTAKKKTAKKKTPKQSATKKKPATSARTLFDDLYEAWSDCKHPALGKLLERLSPFLEPDKSDDTWLLVEQTAEAVRKRSNVPQSHWEMLAKHGTHYDRELLARTLFHCTIKESKVRIKTIEKWPPDPRVTVILARFLKTLPKTSYASQPVYNGIMRALAVCGDVRAKAIVSEIDVAKYMYMPDFFEERVPKLLTKMASEHGAVDDAALAAWTTAVDAFVGAPETSDGPTEFEGVTPPKSTPTLEMQDRFLLRDGLTQWAQRVDTRTLFTFAGAHEQTRRQPMDVTKSFIVLDQGEVVLAGANDGCVRLSDDGRWLAAIHREPRGRKEPSDFRLRMWDLESKAVVVSEILATAQQCRTALSFRGADLFLALKAQKECSLFHVSAGALSTIARADSEQGKSAFEILQLPEHVVFAHSRGVWIVDASTNKLRHAAELGWVHTLVHHDGKLVLKTYSGSPVTTPTSTNKAMYLGQLDVLTAAGDWECNVSGSGGSFYDYDPQLTVANEQVFYLTGPDISKGSTFVRTVDSEGSHPHSTKTLDRDAVRGAFVALGDYALAAGTEARAQWYSLPDLDIEEERQGFLTRVDQVGINRDGTVVLAWRRRKANLWGTKTKRITANSEYGFNTMVVTQDGRFGLSSGVTMHLYSAVGKKLAKMKSGNSRAACHVAATDRFYLAGNGIDVFDPEGNLELRFTEGTRLQRLAVRPDGEVLAGASVETLFLWSRTGAELRKQEWEGIESLQFASDGSLLVLSQGVLTRVDKTLQVKEELAKDVSTVAVAPAGWLAIGHHDGTIQVRGSGDTATLRVFGRVESLAIGDTHLVVGHPTAGKSGTVNVFAL